MTTPSSVSEPQTTRDRLVAAAFRVVARDGLEAASVKTIAAEAGLTPGLLHYHFPSKAALLEAVLRDALADYVEAAGRRRAATAGPDQLSAYFGAMRASLDTAPDFFRVRLAFGAAALTNPALAAVMRELNAAAAGDIALTLAASRGDAPPTARDREIGAMLKAMFDGFMLSWLNDPTFPLEVAARDIERVVKDWSS